MPRCKNLNNINRELVVNTLMVEYQNIHQRVFNQVKQYEANIVKILMLIGVLLYFGITNFSDSSYPMVEIINAIFIIILPLISIASIALTAADVIKIMILGNYLKKIENKVNKVLNQEAIFFHFPEKHILSWEFWRIEKGYANRGNKLAEITFSAFLVVTFLLAAIASVVLRLLFLFEKNINGAQGFFNLSCIIGVVTIAIIICLFIIAINKRKESIANARSNSIEY